MSFSSGMGAIPKKVCVGNMIVIATEEVVQATVAGICKAKGRGCGLHLSDQIIDRNNVDVELRVL